MRFLRLSMLTLTVFCFSVEATSEENICSAMAGESAQTSACEIQFEADKCDEFKKIIEESNMEPDLLKSCPEKKSDAVIAAAICSPYVMSLGSAQIEKFGVRIAEKVPPKILSKLVALPRFLSVLAVPLTAYTLYDFTEKAIEKDKKCFEDKEEKIEKLNFLKNTSENVISKIEPFIDESSRRSLNVPDEYFEENFINNLSCQRLNEIISNKKKKQDQIIGGLLASKKINEDPRKALSLTDEEILQTKQVSTYFSCVSKAKQLQFLCAVGNSVYGGRDLKALLKGRSPSNLANREVQYEVQFKEDYLSKISKDKALPFSFNCKSKSTCENEVILNQNFADHIRPHYGWDANQRKYFDEMLENVNQGRVTSEKEIEYWLNAYQSANAKKGLVNPSLGPRPFRNNKLTSFYPEGVKPDDVLETFKTQGATKIVQSNGREIESEIFRVKHGENFYDMIICAKKTCPLKDPDRLAQKDEVISLFPACGDNVFAYKSAKNVKDILRNKKPPLTESDFIFKPECDK